MVDLRWLVFRIASMTPREVLHRLGEQRARAAWRSYDSGWADFLQTDGPLPCIPDLRDKILNRLDEALAQRLKSGANDLMAGKFAMLGQKWPTTASMRDGVSTTLGHLDPITSSTWPDR